MPARCEQADVARSERPSFLEANFPSGKVQPDAPNMLSNFRGLANFNVATEFDGILLKHDQIRAFRNDSTGEDADTRFFHDSTLEALARTRHSNLAKPDR
jgi:hypothetical protein